MTAVAKDGDQTKKRDCSLVPFLPLHHDIRVHFTKREGGFYCVCFSLGACSGFDELALLACLNLGYVRFQGLSDDSGFGIVVAGFGLFKIVLAGPFFSSAIFLEERATGVQLFMLRGEREIGRWEPKLALWGISVACLALNGRVGDLWEDWTAAVPGPRRLRFRR